MKQLTEMITVYFGFTTVKGWIRIRLQIQSCRCPVIPNCGRHVVFSIWYDDNVHCRDGDMDENFFVECESRWKL